MYAPDLNRVLVQGTLSPDPFEERQLQANPYTGQPLQSDIRALVYLAGDLMQAQDRASLVAWVRKNVRKALDHGAGCFVCAIAGQENLAKQTLDVSEETRPAEVVSAKPAEIAQRCLRWNPGPAPKVGLTVQSSDALEPDTELLLKRAFRDFDEITLKRLTGGRSAVEGVWRVDAKANDLELRSPFVVKCGPRISIDKQVNTYRDVVADRVPYRGCAPLCLERSVSGFSKRLSVSRFVEDAKRLDEIILDPNHPNVESLIGKIYEGPLHRWRSTTVWRQINFTGAFLGSDPLRYFGYGVAQARRKLAAQKVSTSTLRANLKRLKAVPRTSAPICRSHDDLNFRNVFVASEGGEIILIDFTRAVEKPLSMDVARMDVGFAFDDELNNYHRISDDILINYFTGDLFSISLPHLVSGRGAKSRLTAIEALRRRILKEADALSYDPRVEYKIAIIAGLLYEAKRGTSLSPLAYSCADQLVSTL